MSEFFTSDEINELAKTNKFVQREHPGRMDGEIFLNLIVFNNENLKEQSLEDLTGILKTEYKLIISKQALGERFNKYAVIFLATALEKLLNQQLQSHTIDLLSHEFNRVLIKDSVCFQIHESLAEYYPGSGGTSSKASIRIQFEYELLSGKIIDISINAFNEQDASNSIATIGKVKSGNLIIRDLAYMSIGVLKKIIATHAFYLCRPKTNVKMYELIYGKYVEIDFFRIANTMKKCNMLLIEKEAYYGKNDKLKVRWQLIRNQGHVFRSNRKHPGNPGKQQQSQEQLAKP